MSTYVGIDVGAKRCEWAWREAGCAREGGSFEQNPGGHAAVIARLKRLVPERVVLEATGVYYLDLALALHAAGLPVAVINPKSFHHFVQLKLKVSKTDRLDAGLLAEYAERMRPALWTPPEPTCLALRDIGRQIGRLTHMRTQAKNRLHALTAKCATPRLLINDERAGIRALDRRARLSQAGDELIAQAPALAKHFACLRTAKGIGRISAVALLGELCVLPEEMKTAQLARHAGLDVRLTQSGTSVNKPGRLSKSGNRYLRAALYMPALSAVRYDPHARAFYHALIARGKEKLQALCAVMRKYLTGLWACLKAGEPFDSSRLFSSIHIQGA
ncbi:MAG TPA: IS110 family transposase [Gammaproteobacteria bacterium]|nr:IS110 family transposase [Gammaproteobacteria bacterium]